MKQEQNTLDLKTEEVLRILEVACARLKEHSREVGVRIVTQEPISKRSKKVNTPKRPAISHHRKDKHI